MSVYNRDGILLTDVYDISNNALQAAYDVYGNLIYSPSPIEPLPVPSGVLVADNEIPLPDLYEAGKGFTCTGLVYDSVNEVYLVGDIGVLQPGGGTIQSQIVKLSYDFSTVVGTIPLYSTFPTMRDVQGITIDTTDNSIWFCSPSENKIRHINQNGGEIGYVAITSPTGVSYDKATNTLWTVTYEQKIINVTKNGTINSSYTWSGSDTLDQCFIDSARGFLYFDAGANYSTANYLYLFNTADETVSIACTLSDSYSVEGISLESDRLVIVNDGYYHGAATSVNQANVYSLE